MCTKYNVYELLLSTAGRHVFHSITITRIDIDSIRILSLRQSTHFFGIHLTTQLLWIFGVHNLNSKQLSICMNKTNGTYAIQEIQISLH